MLRTTRNVPYLLSAIALTAGLSFAQTGSTVFQDVLTTGPDAAFYTVIQTALRLGLAVPSHLGACILPNTGKNPPILPPPGGGNTQPPATMCPYFGPDDVITRAETAYWIVRSQMDETDISTYLCSTGGDPSGLTPGCNTGGVTSGTFADSGIGGASIKNPFVGISNAQLQRYVEVMARRGYSKGCSATDDPTKRFCPNDPVNRAQMAVFIIRAKMNNVFPTSVSGANGDNFPYPSTPYFTDVTPTDPIWGGYFPFVQKLRELNITYGTSPTTFSPGNNVTRKEITAFSVHAFFF
jgi:hypothetical protein